MNCAKCKGYRKLCGLSKCPILERIRAWKIANWKGKKAHGPTPPSVIVGESGYPYVPLMVGVAPSYDEIYENPEKWFEMRLPLSEIIKLRASMLTPFKRVRVNDLNDEVVWAGVSTKPVDVEARLFREPLPPSFDGVLKPVGPSAPGEIKVVSNPKVDPVIDRLSNDDVKAEEGVKEAWEKGVNNENIVRAFSLGLLGKNKKMVPTRWAITAVDTIVSEEIKSKMRDWREVGYERMGVYEHYGNKYVVILRPDVLEVEMYEVWKRGSLWARDRDEIIYNRERLVKGAKALDPRDGGFHALKRGFLEALSEFGVRSGATIVRIVDNRYYAPVGSWQIRLGVKEATRRAIMGKGTEKVDIGIKLRPRQRSLKEFLQ